MFSHRRRRRCFLAAFVLTLAASSAGAAQVALEVAVSADLVRTASQPVDDARPVHVCVLGFDVSGRPRLTGFASVALVPSEKHGLVRLTLRGDEIGLEHDSRRRLRLDTRDSARVFVRQDFSVADQVREAGPPLIHASAETRLLHAETDFRPLPDLLARGVAWAGFHVTTRRNNFAATEATEQILAEQLALDLTGRLASVNQAYREQVLEPLGRLGIAPSDLTCSSTADALYLRAGLPDLAERQEVGGVPPLLRGADVRLSIHQELLNRAFRKEWGGRVLTGEEIEKQARRLADLSGRPLPNPTEEKDLSITLDETAPLTIRFERDQVVLTLRGTEYTSGDTSYPAMNVTSRWDLVSGGGGARLVRRPQLEIYPPGFVPGSGMRLPFRLQTLRNLLNRRFNRLLPTELDLNRLRPPEASPGMPRGSFSRLTAGNGWLVVDWDRAK